MATLLLAIAILLAVVTCYVLLLIRVDRYSAKRFAEAREIAAGSGPSLFNDNLASLLLWGIVGLISANRGLGCVLVLLALPTVPALAIEAIKCIWKPERRRQLRIDASIIFGTSLLVLIVHGYYFLHARHNGELLLARVEQFQHIHGHYPSNIKELGIGPADHSIDQTLAFYEVRDGKPQVMHAASYIYWSHYYYDLERHQWMFWIMD